MKRCKRYVQAVIKAVNVDIGTTNPGINSCSPAAALILLMKRLLLVRHAECEMNLQTKGFVSG
jgi:hypothetical protein